MQNEQLHVHNRTMPPALSHKVCLNFLFRSAQTKPCQDRDNHSCLHAAQRPVPSKLLLNDQSAVSSRSRSRAPQMQRCLVAAKHLSRFPYYLLAANFATASTAKLEQARLTRFRTAPVRQSISIGDSRGSAAKTIAQSHDCVSKRSLQVGNTALNRGRIDGLHTLPRQTSMDNAVARSVNESAATADSEQTIRRGAFIVLEGIDRSGKSTQAQRFVDFLKSQGVSLHTLPPCCLVYVLASCICTGRFAIVMTEVVEGGG